MKKVGLFLAGFVSGIVSYFAFLNILVSIDEKKKFSYDGCCAETGANDVFLDDGEGGYFSKDSEFENVVDKKESFDQQMGFHKR